MNQKPTIITFAAVSAALVLMVFFLVFKFASKSSKDGSEIGILNEIDLELTDLPEFIDPNLVESNESMPFAKSAFSALRDLLAALAAENAEVTELVKPTTFENDIMSVQLQQIDASRFGFQNPESRPSTRRL